VISNKLLTQIKSALNSRNGWEQKQRDWYNLRYTGYGRPTLPYPNAPDMHYPLVDTQIEKLKPLYIGQIYEAERLATFVDLSRGEPVAARRRFRQRVEAAEQLREGRSHLR